MCINHKDPKGLLEQCFLQMEPYIWYTIIPSNSSSVGTVSFSIGQSWALLSNLFLHHKLISFREQKYSVYAKKNKDIQKLTYDWF